jgi:hypothetical protein
MSAFFVFRRKPRAADIEFLNHVANGCHFTFHRDVESLNRLYIALFAIVTNGCHFYFGEEVEKPDQLI